MLIDLGAFDANIDTVRQAAEGSGKTIRLGTKSIRCEPLLRYIFERGNTGQSANPVFKGLLSFTVEETAWLALKGCDDIIMAYPTF